MAATRWKPIHVCQCTAAGSSVALACGRTRFDGTSLCVAGRSGRGDANRHARESRARSTSESARRSLEGAGGFALASRCIGERHARHALPACTSTPTDQHAHGGGAGKSPKGFRPAGRRSLKRQVRAPIKKRRGVGATITSHALHSCAPAPFTAELLPPKCCMCTCILGPLAYVPRCERYLQLYLRPQIQLQIQLF